MSDFWTQFGGRPTVPGIRPVTNTSDFLLWGREDEDEDEDIRQLRERSEERARQRELERANQQRERTFFERVFAPFEATQQALFRTTVGLANEGENVVQAVSQGVMHGLRFFNPFGNEERISEDEIRQIFFGEDPEDHERTWAQSALNFGLVVAFDPAWLVPLVGPAARAAGLTGRALNVATKVGERVAAPGIMALDAGAGAWTGGRKGIRNLVEKYGGAEATDRYVQATTRLSQFLTKGTAGMSAQEAEALDLLRVRMMEHTAEGAQVLKAMSRISKRGRELLTEAVESTAVREIKLLGNAPTELQQRSFDRLLRRLQKEGVDEDLFWEAYAGIQKVEINFLDIATKLNIIPEAEAAELGGRHLYKLYNFFDHPSRALEAVERLIRDPNTPTRMLADQRIFDGVKLRKSLREAARNFDETAFADPNIVRRTTVSGEATEQARRLFEPGAQFGTDFSQPNLNRYFPVNEQGRRQFADDVFINDFATLLERTPDISMDSALKYVKHHMFEGAQVPDVFMERIANYLAKGMVDAPGLLSWKDKLMNQAVMGTAEFRTLRSQMERLAAREGIPEQIRREVLDEVLDAGPRFAASIDRSARQIEITRTLDNMSGAVRADSALLDLGSQLRANRMTPEQALAAVQQKIPGISAREAQNLVRRMQIAPGKRGALRETEVVHSFDTALSTRTRVAGKDQVQLPNTEELGSLAGRYVSPGLALQLRALTAVKGADSSRSRAAFEAVGNALQRGTSQFKMFKIPLDAGANFRDWVGTMMQMDISGINPLSADRLNKAFHGARRYFAGQLDEYTQAAHSVGYKLLDNGFSATELRQITTDADFARKLVNPSSWTEAGESLFTEVGRAFERLQGVQRKMAFGYQFRDGMYRYYTFSSVYDKLKEGVVRAGGTLDPETIKNIARQAAAKTDRAMFNYADVPGLVEFMRDYGIAPFITFPYKAAPQLLEALYNNPARVLKYDRGVRVWNEHHAGSPEDLAREINGLPEHKRRAMVVRMPGEDMDGKPRYLDLSYFMPWFSIKDTMDQTIDSVRVLLGGQAEQDELREALAGNRGQRGSLISFLPMQVTNALFHNKDGLGRPIWNETDEMNTKMMKFGRFMFQFIASPTWPGGTTADSVGRAMIAASRNSPEPVDWVEMLGGLMRTPFSENDDILDRYGRRPTSRALVGGSLGGEAVGLERGSGMDILRGAAQSLFLNTTTLDPVRQFQNERTQTNLSSTEIDRRIAQVRSNRNMSLEQKRAEILRLMQLKASLRQGLGERARAMF